MARPLDAPPLSICEVLEQEYDAVHGPPTDGHSRSSSDERLRAIYKLIHATPRAALCLSGGGIRSATFALGVVQGLARHGVLDKFHFLSTVSGGGYLGSWLTAWAHRDPDGLAGVCRQLAAPALAPLSPEPAPIRHLRGFSNYLSPRLGVLSADTWTLVGTYLRNLLLNWLLIVPFLLLVLAVPRLCVAVVLLGDRIMPVHAEGALALGLLLGLVSLVYIGIQRPSTRRSTVLRSDDSGCSPPASSERHGESQGAFLLWCLGPLVGCAVSLTTYFTWRACFPAPPGVLGFVYAITGLHLAAWLVYAAWRRRLRLAEFLVVVATGIVGGALAYRVGYVVFPRPDEKAMFYTCFAAPLFMVLFLMAGTLFVGLGSRWMDDDDREWHARFGAWILILVVGWTIGSAIVAFGPTWLAEQGRGVVAAFGSAGGLAGLVTVLFGWSATTPAGKGRPVRADTNAANREGASKDGASPAQSWFSRFSDYAALLAAPVFAGFLLVLLTVFSDLLLVALSRLFHRLAATPIMTVEVFNHAGVMMSAPVEVVLLFMAFLSLATVVLSHFINVNRFSLHAMYRSRLIRAYLGASRVKRKPNLFTGFDPDDNVGMSRLWPFDCHQRTKKRLFPVVNCALNLVRGDDLAWQERKADSFTISPLHSGSFRLGYRPSAEYAQAEPGVQAISLGTAITISGAAASPNMGYHSSALVTFLMALFNARLGVWLGNPGKAGEKTFSLSQPTQAIQPMVQEMFGLTNACNPYVYLSDGGHFENLALYEMVLRRCHLILVSDASCDTGYGYEDLGNAIRKIRVDFGVPIVLDDLPVIGCQAAVGGQPPPGVRCCAVGSIQYKAVDGKDARDGLLLYLKPAVTGREPADVRAYARAVRDFPNETTADQWFSESQFETYRALGNHVLDDACAGGNPLFDKFVAELKAM